LFWVSASATSSFNVLSFSLRHQAASTSAARAASAREAKSAGNLGCGLRNFGPTVQLESVQRMSRKGLMGS
jgi:hypothetical protein